MGEADVTYHNEPLFPGFITFRLPLLDLTDEDLATIRRQASELSVQFGERHGVEGIFTLIYQAARREPETRQQLPNRESIEGATSPDVTAPPAHEVDDLAHAMFWIMAIIDDPATSPGVAAAWNIILSDLASEGRRRMTKLSGT